MDIECLKKGGKIKQKQKQRQKQKQTVNVYVGGPTRNPKSTTTKRRPVRQHIEMPRFAMHDSGFQRLATPMTHTMPIHVSEPARHIALPISAEPMKPAPLSSLPSLVPTYITPAEPHFAPGEKEIAVSSQLEDTTPFSQEKEHNKPVPLSSFGEDEEPEEKEAHKAYSDIPVQESIGISAISPEDEIAQLEELYSKVKAIPSGKATKETGNDNRKDELNQMGPLIGLPLMLEGAKRKNSIEYLKKRIINAVEKRIALLKK